MERGAVTKSHKGRKASVERKVGECYQWKATGQCSKGDTCSFSHDRASGNRHDQRRDGQSSYPTPKAQTQTDGKKPSKGSGLRGESPSGKGGRIAFRNLLRESTIPSCNYWHPPVCLNYKSGSGCKYGEKGRFRHAEFDGQPGKKSKKSGVKGSVASLKESIQNGCVFRNSTERRTIRIKTRRQILQGHVGTT